MTAFELPPIELNEQQSPGVDALEAIARGAQLRLKPYHWHRVHRCHQFLNQLIDQRARIYGVTTGYGPLADTYIDPDASAQLQRGLVYHLCAGTGPLLKPIQVRAIIAERAITLAQGHSAVHPDSLQRLLDCLDEDLVPDVPSMGTVGASGDLTPLAHITLCLMGEGSVRLKGQPMSSKQAHQTLGWMPLSPEGKDALALVNGTSAMTAIAALNGAQSRRCLDLSLALTLLYGEIFEYQAEALQPELSQIRAHPGQAWAQGRLLELARDSQRLLAYSPAPEPLPEGLTSGNALHQQPIPQAPYSFRCAPQHLGSVADVLEQHNHTADIEITAVTDNPVFFPEEGKVVHGGNFFGQPVAFASDALNNALLTLAIHSERRIARLTDPQQNGALPAFLRGNNNGLHSGFMGAQVTATSLVAEMRTHSHPASTQSVSTNANNQDVVTMGTIAARRVSDTLERLEEVLAIEAMILVQAYEQTGGKTGGYSSNSEQLASWVRAQVAPLVDDRPLSTDIQTLARHITQFPTS